MLEPQLLSSLSEFLSSPPSSPLPDPTSLVVGSGKVKGQGIDLQVLEISTPAIIVVFVLSAAFSPTIIIFILISSICNKYNYYITDS